MPRYAGDGATISINDVTYQLNDVTSINFVGNGGSDSAHLTGSAQRDRVITAPGTAQMTGVGYQVNIEGIAALTVNGGGGRDTITILGKRRSRCSPLPFG